MRRDMNLVVTGFLAIACSWFFAAQTAPAFAEDDQGRGGGWGGNRYDEVIRDLNLTAEQQQRIQQQRAEHREKREVRRQRMDSVREELRRELESEKPDRAKVDNLNAELKGILGAGMDERIEGVMTMREILTPEQFKAVNKRMDDQRESRKEKFKRGGWN